MVKRSRGRWSLIKRRSSFSSFLRGSDPMASMERGLLSSECLIITRMTYFMSTQELLFVQTSRCSRSRMSISPNNLWTPMDNQNHLAKTPHLHFSRKDCAGDVKSLPIRL